MCCEMWCYIGDEDTMESRQQSSGRGLEALQRLLGFCSPPFDVFSRHPRSEQRVPVHKEWLCKVGLDTNDLRNRQSIDKLFIPHYYAYLVMNIVIVRVITGNHLERVPGEAVPAVVVDGLQGRHGEEKHGLADAHAARPLRDKRAEAVEQEALDGVVI